MKLNGTENLRIRRTVTNIKSAFEALICEKEYDSITVKELSDRAMINKKTFYQYYNNLDELLSKLKTDFSSRQELVCPNSNSKKNGHVVLVTVNSYQIYSIPYSFVNDNQDY